MRFKVSITGAKRLQTNLKKLGDKAKRLNKERNVPLEELLDRKFMRAYTSHTSVDAMFKASGYDIFGADDLEKIPANDLDSIVRNNTRFSSWKEMLVTAGEQYFAKQLSLGR